MIACVKNLWKNNDEKAKLTLKTWQNDIALGILGLNNLFDADCFVLSGSMEKFVNVNEIEKFVNENIVTTPTKIFHAKAGNYAGMIGAVLLGNELI
jgi:predicted NBD/HSP70 family sugar kinase